MPSKVIGLSQVLKFLNIKIRVSGEGAKELFHLREVSEGEGGMEPHNAFHPSHFLERVEGNRLTGGSVRVSVCGAYGILWSWVGGRVGGRRGRRRGRRQWLNNENPSLIWWRLVGREEGKKERLQSKQGVQRRIWMVLRLI
jgi:hypothetical protein